MKITRFISLLLIFLLNLHRKYYEKRAYLIFLTILKMLEKGLKYDSFLVLVIIMWMFLCYAAIIESKNYIVKTSLFFL